MNEFPGANVLMGQGQACSGPERIPRSQAAGGKVEFFARSKDVCPELNNGIGGKKDFKPKFTGIPGSG